MKKDETSTEGLPPEYSEESLALLFVTQHSHEVRYVSAWGKWLIYNGTHWQAEDTLQVSDMVRRICRRAAAKCAAAEKNRDWLCRRIASSQTVAAVEKLARSDRRIAATVDQWDVDPWLLNTPAGSVDLRTGLLRPHHAEDFVTKITNASPAGTPCLRESFLLKITRNNNDLVDYLQRVCGYILTGLTCEHAFFFCFGPGGNGKGVFLNTLTSIMGQYAAIASMETFCASTHERHSTELAMLRGARFVTAQETEEGRRWAESKIKAMTGGDPITARFMRQDFFTFQPQFKLIIAGNHKPGLRNVDNAMRRRLHLIPFEVIISDEEQDRDLPEKLKAEWPAILQWMIEGARKWGESCLTMPAAVHEATKEYFADEDLLERWLSECCVMSEHVTSDMTSLFGNWSEWCEAAHEQSITLKRFSQQLRIKRPELRDWQCPTSRRKGLKGIQAIKAGGSSWQSD